MDKLALLKEKIKELDEKHSIELSNINLTNSDKNTLLDFIDIRSFGEIYDYNFVDTDLLSEELMRDLSLSVISILSSCTDKL